jgi:hypothetical protein
MHVQVGGHRALTKHCSQSLPGKQHTQQEDTAMLCSRRMCMSLPFTVLNSYYKVLAKVADLPFPLDVLAPSASDHQLNA